MTMKRRRDPDRRRRRHQADARRRHAHQRDRDEEGVFAPELVAEIAEQDRAERTEAEADREAGPGEQGLQQFVSGGKKVRPMIPLAASVP